MTNRGPARIEFVGGADPGDFVVDVSETSCAWTTSLPPGQSCQLGYSCAPKAAGLRTAWTDKHPSYEWTNGPSGKGVDDFYGPEINSIPVALAFAGCTPVPYPDPTPDDGWTTALANVRCYDQILSLIHI